MVVSASKAILTAEGGVACSGLTANPSFIHRRLRRQRPLGFNRALTAFDSHRGPCKAPNMSNTPTRNFSLTPVLEDYIRAQVASGHYANASEVVRAGLRLLMERDQVVSRPSNVESKARAAR